MVTPNGMIITSPIECKVGSVVYMHYKHHLDSELTEKQPFFIHRTATREEWLEDCKNNNIVLAPNYTIYPFYYEVTTD